MHSQTPVAVVEQPLLRARMPELDSLRGIAILLVLFLHGFAYVADPSSFTGLRREFMVLTSYGWIGVQLFFVLSGFLITGILLESRLRPDYYRRFYKRRALRILPAYYGLLLILLALNQTSWLGHRTGLPFLLFSFAYLSNVTPLFGIPIQYTVLWSLAVEEHFYLVWPMIVRNISRRALALVGLGVFLSAPILRAFTIRFGSLTNGNFYTWCNADGLALGALLAMALRVPDISRRLLWGLSLFVAGFSGATLVAAAKVNALAWASTSGFALRLTLLNSGFAALLVLTLLLGTAPSSFVVNIPFLRFFGEISYGLYLLHMLFFYGYEETVRRYWPSLGVVNGQFGNVVLQFICAGGASIIVATLSRRCFEEYFLSLKDGRSGKAERRSKELRLRQTCDLNATVS